MKKIFTFLLLLFALSFQSQAQDTLQASLGLGSAANRVKIYIKSDSTVTCNISTLEFNIAVPQDETVATPVLISSASSVPWTISPAVTEGGYNNFSITTVASPITYSLTAGVEFEVMELEFSDSIALPDSVSLVTIPDGGSNGFLLFYSTGDPISDGSNLYYGRIGTTYTTKIQNGPSYGPGGNSFISSATLIASPTPVKLSTFNVTAKNNTSLLTWTVENQDANSGYFAVERSANGTDFNQVGTVNATTSSSASYSYTDNSLNLSGTVYYRLKMVDKNGQYTYSDIKRVQFANKGFAVTLYPNPVQSLAKLNITLDQSQIIKVSVNDALGNVVKQMEIKGQKGINQKTIDLSSAPAGSYMIRIQAGQNIKTMPVIKN